MAARIDDGRAQLLTWTGLDWTDKYPAAIAALANVNVKTAYIERLLLVASRTEKQRAGRATRTRSSAWRHQFISGAGRAHSTIEPDRSCRSLAGSACGRSCGSRARNRKANVVINRHFAVDVVEANADGDVVADHHVVGR
jgi:hypothetical protein